MSRRAASGVITKSSPSEAKYIGDEPAREPVTRELAVWGRPLMLTVNSVSPPAERSLHAVIPSTGVTMKCASMQLGRPAMTTSNLAERGEDEANSQSNLDGMTRVTPTPARESAVRSCRSCSAVGIRDGSADVAGALGAGLPLSGGGAVQLTSTAPDIARRTSHVPISLVQRAADVVPAHMAACR